MNLEVTFLDIAGGEYREVIGPFESVQVTNNMLRDQDGHDLARFDCEEWVWFNLATGNGWYDWTVSEVFRP